MDSQIPCSVEDHRVRLRTSTGVRPPRQSSRGDLFYRLTGQPLSFASFSVVSKSFCETNPASARNDFRCVSEMYMSSFCYIAIAESYRMYRMHPVITEGEAPC